MPPMRRLTTQLGELSCRVLDFLPEGSRPQLAVVLCHGFGAPAEDLVPLGPELVQLAPALAPHVRFVFPGAPLSLAALGMPSGRAWWQLPTALLTGQLRDWDLFARSIPEGLPQARRAVTSVVQALSAAWGLPLGRVVLGGFSQGAMVTTDVALRLEEAPGGLCLLSGSLIAREEWERLAGRRQGLPVFQSHGRYDDVLPFAPAEALRALLTKAGLQVDFHPFEGPHGIPPDTLRSLADWLVARLGAR